MSSRNIFRNIIYTGAQITCNMDDGITNQKNILAVFIDGFIAGNVSTVYGENGIITYHQYTAAQRSCGIVPYFTVCHCEVCAIT